jgi:alpha-amylase
MFNNPKTLLRRSLLLGAAVLPVIGHARHALAEDVSPPVILQWFESSYKTIESRMADVHRAGYGAIWTPPPGRADQGGFSVGYDVYDRFDLGTTTSHTLYGTATGIKQTASTIHRAGLEFHVDFVLNHNGYSSTGGKDDREAFIAAGGYPGFFSTFFDDPDGDFNSAFDYGDLNGRLAGLIDIAHRKNYRAIRNPVPGFANNIAAGTVPQWGRLANVALESNRQFYPDRDGPAIFVFDPITGEQNIPVYSFNTANPMAGDPVEENALGYLMRNAQWLVQTVGVDGLRIDAAKHVEGWVLDYLDRAVYRSNPRNLLDGSPRHVFSYSEVFDGNTEYLLTHVKKTINPNDPGRIGGNRDTLDFASYFAMKANLEDYGTSGAWYNIRNADLDFADDQKHNGSAGVKFVNNHDVFAPYKLNNVAHAYALMMPGNATVYFNGKEFGDNRDFPKDGRGDALSVGSGSVITDLVDIRNTHGRGDYRERWIDNEGLYIFERSSSAVVGLSNRGDGGYDQRTVRVDFAPGTHLLELTGNAASGLVDPGNDIPEVVTVFQGNDGNSYANIRVPRNFNYLGNEHQRGYIIYGLPTPQSANGIELSNVSMTLAGDSTPNNNYENGTQRQSSVKVLTGDTTRLRLMTNEVRLLGLDSLRDIYADGDFAAFKIDGGVDMNGNGAVDFVAPNSTVYGFENFVTKNKPLIGRNAQFASDINAPRGDGEFLQDLDLTKLSEGYHFIEARAFRHRTDGGPAVFSRWTETIYVDRLKPVSSVGEFRPFGTSAGDNDIWIKSDDMTANNVHVFMNLPANVTNAQIMQMVQNGQGGTDQLDRDIFKTGFFGIPNGNNVFTIVTFEITGNNNIQRITGVKPGNVRGAGMADLNHDGVVATGDVAGTGYGFEAVLYSRNGSFNPAADFNADGLIDNRDMFAFESHVQGNPSVAAEARAMVLRRGNINGEFGTDQWDIDTLYDRLGKTGDNWFEDLNVDGVVDQSDVNTLVRQVLRSEFGDFNLDAKIDAVDLGLLASNWGQTNRGYATADANGDGFVDAVDLGLLATYWGFGVAPQHAQSIYAAAYSIGFTAIPEPATLSLLGLGATLLGRRNRRTTHQAQERLS